MARRLRFAAAVWLLVSGLVVFWLVGMFALRSNLWLAWIALLAAIILASAQLVTRSPRVRR